MSPITRPLIRNMIGHIHICQGKLAPPACNTIQ